jgi:hypothetical protein
MELTAGFCKVGAGATDAPAIRGASSGELVVE